MNSGWLVTKMVCPLGTPFRSYLGSTNRRFETWQYKREYAKVFPNVFVAVFHAVTRLARSCAQVVMTRFDPYDTRRCMHRVKMSEKCIDCENSDLRRKLEKVEKKLSDAREIAKEMNFCRGPSDYPHSCSVCGGGTFGRQPGSSCNEFKLLQALNKS